MSADIPTGEPKRLTADDGHTDGTDVHRVGNTDNLLTSAKEGILYVARSGRRAEEEEAVSSRLSACSSERVPLSSIRRDNSREVEGRQPDRLEHELHSVVGPQEGESELAEETLTRSPDAVEV